MDIQPTIDNQQMLPKGTMLKGRYRIERYISSGGFGKTYLATDVDSFDETVAIKEFYLSGYSDRKEDGCTVTIPKASEELFRQQKDKFLREAERLYELTKQHHNPHIVQVKARFEANNTAYYVMNYINGLSLSQAVKKNNRPFSETETEEILLQLADALQTAHSMGIQHLDIKPGNIMLDEQQQVYLIDFGASKQLNDEGQLTRSLSAMAHTPGYAPFEQMDQIFTGIGPWTDIYAVGATVYYLLTAERPPMPSEVLRKGEAAFHFPSIISDRFRHFVLACMQPNSDKRPQSVAEMLELLKAKPTAPKAPEEEVTVVEVEKPKLVEKPKQAEKQKPVEHQPVEKPKPQKPVSPKKTEPKPVETPKKKSNIPKIAIGALLGVVLVVLAIVLLKGKDDSTKNADNLLIPEDIETDTNPTTDSETGATESSLPSRETITVKGVSFDMIKVERGTFLMGAQNRDSVIAHFDKDAEIFEGPVHEETIRTFYIGETEVTQELWQAVMGWNYSQFKGSQKPVENVSWNNCQTFIDSLNSCTGRKFRLPTEAEWEYAARGGNQSKDYKYSGSNTLKDVAWYNANSSSTTHPVKKKAPNELGLYDMSGNVWEWTSSYWRNDYNASEDRSRCVMRGDCWMGNEKGMRVTYRHRSVPGSRFEYFGLRLALDPQ